MNLAANRLMLGRVLPLLLLGGMAGAPAIRQGRLSVWSRMFNQPTTYAAEGPNAGQPIGGAVDRAVLLPGGDYSLITLRQRPDTGQIPKVLCQAPSPDWATAIAMQRRSSPPAEISSTAVGQFAGSNSYSETIAAMAGRTAGVVALRDGLYSACQAYANGVIGKDHPMP